MENVAQEFDYNKNKDMDGWMIMHNQSVKFQSEGLK